MLKLFDCIVKTFRSEVEGCSAVKFLIIINCDAKKGQIFLEGKKERERK